MSKARRPLVFGVAPVLSFMLAFADCVRAEDHTQRLPSAAEARDRAEILHETIHSSLQIVHHEYYREDEGLAIPASTLKKIFRELSDRKRISARWLVVDGTAMNTDHLPQDEFARKAAAALAAGKGSYEETTAGTYRRAAGITLTANCLKCHLPNRKSTEDRTAGLILSIPIAHE